MRHGLIANESEQLFMDIQENQGYFISLEGGEGCGKSTHLNLLGQRIRETTDRELIVTRSPGGTQIAEQIRTILKTRLPEEPLASESELLLFGACHAQMARHLILPAWKRGALILTDRFYDSTTVYQGYARGLDLDFVQKINRFACGGLRPDLTILLDLPVEKAMSRIAGRSNSADLQSDRFDSESKAFHEAIRAGFLTLAKQEPDRFRIVDADADQHTVQQRIREVVREKLGLL